MKMAILSDLITYRLRFAARCEIVDQSGYLGAITACFEVDVMIYKLAIGLGTAIYKCTLGNWSETEFGKDSGRR